MDARREQLLRSIPAVHRLLARPEVGELVARYGRRWVAWALDRATADLRRRIRTAEDPGPAAVRPDAIVQAARRELARLFDPSLRRVINATGIVLHTNLGRAPLPEAAVAALAEAAGRYSPLEYDLERGQRGSRQDHVEGLLTALTGAEAALAVNNNAAAVLLALTALAAGREVIVSRGELVEIGGSFRIPEILAQSGARLVEVGTTNRTHLADYQRAIGPDTALLLKVHRSNYRLVGFTAEVDVADLAALGRRHGLPVLFDLGSGLLAQDLAPPGSDEPGVREALAKGADLVAFSGDKLLGGPQAGLLVGRRELVEACRRHPLARAVRIDKLGLAALAAVLRIYLEPERARREIPVLAMLHAGPEALRPRAEALAARLQAALPPGSVRVEEGWTSEAGGGALPGIGLPTLVVSVAPPGGVDELERRLRQGVPPVVARVHRERLLLDLRTVFPDEDPLLAERVIAAARGSG